MCTFASNREPANVQKIPLSGVDFRCYPEVERELTMDMDENNFLAHLAKMDLLREGLELCEGGKAWCGYCECELDPSQIWEHALP